MKDFNKWGFWSKKEEKILKEVIEKLSIPSLLLNSPRGSGKNWLYEKIKEYQEETPEDYFRKRYTNVWVDEAKNLKEVNMANVYYDAPEIVKKYQEVKITKVQNGWIIKIGCATFVETSWKKICSALKEYWDDPVKAEKKYYKK